MGVIMLLAALALLALAQRLVYRRLWNRGLDFSLTIPETAVFEGESITVVERIANRKRLPLPWVHVSCDMPGSFAFTDDAHREYEKGRTEEHSALFVVGMNKALSRRIKARCTKRGFYPVREAKITSGDLLLSRLYTERRPLCHDVTVYPRLIDEELLPMPLRGLLGAVSVRRFINPDPFAFKGIREYLPTDSLRQVNFKATAKTGVLMSNVYDCTVDQDVVILLNLERYNGFDLYHVHENAIRLAACIARVCIGRGIPVGLVCSAPDAGTGKPAAVRSGLSGFHLFAVYEALARISLKSDLPSIAAHMPADPRGEKVFILISSCHERHIVESVRKLREGGSAVLWVAPADRRDGGVFPPDEEICVWEVPDDQTP